MALCTHAHAVDIEIGASITLRAMIGVQKNRDMNFGVIEFMPDHQGQIHLDTSGQVSFGNATGLNTRGGNPTSASLDISGDSHSVINVSCDSSATLKSAGGQILPMTKVEFSVGSGVGMGAGIVCAGLDQAVGNIYLSGAAEEQIFVGGTIDVAPHQITEEGAYSSVANGSGIRMRFVYQ